MSELPSPDYEAWRVDTGGSPVDTAAVDANDKAGLEKEAGKELLEDHLDALRHLQYRLYGEGQRSLLVVLQGRDAAGKDSTIRHVFGPLNPPQGCHVTSFKKPSDEELAHDYLWRIHRAAPQRGSIGVFNRSHYEDVLVVRVHDLVPEEQWRARYDQINAFEKHLADNGTAILKFYLHIDADEQKERLNDRLKDPEKLWKFNPGDLAERAKWDDYTAAFDEALGRCSTPWAPWYIIPANRKWVRNALIAGIVRRTLEGLDLRLPEASVDPADYHID